MIYFTQLIFVKPGMEETFHAFENGVLPLLARHQGRLLYRARPATSAIVHSEVGEPYEIHLISFASEEDFQAYANDKERQQYLGLRDDSVQKVLLLRGNVV
jgi:uncharacterized protein (DUF1330 family)